MYMEKVTYFVPKEELEPMAVKQIEETADLEFVEGLAVMPDAWWRQKKKKLHQK